MAQDDSYYEIQLTNKQLVFYFMAAAAVLVLSFLAGVMVGRGVDSEPQAAKPPAQDDRLVEETVRPAPPAAEDLTYARQLEGDKLDESLDKPKPEPSRRPEAPTPAPVATTQPAAPPPTTAPAPPRATPAPKPSPVRAAARPSARPTPRPEKPSPAPAAGTFTIQVGAFKDRSSADSVVGRLKGKGFAAYVVAGAAEGLFNVRVGSFVDRGDAQRVADRLRDQEKYKPFIVRN